MHTASPATRSASVPVRMWLLAKPQAPSTRTRIPKPSVSFEATPSTRPVLIAIDSSCRRTIRTSAYRAPRDAAVSSARSVRSRMGRSAYQRVARTTLGRVPYPADRRVSTLDRCRRRADNNSRRGKRGRKGCDRGRTDDATTGRHARRRPTAARVVGRCGIARRRRRRLPYGRVRHRTGVPRGRPGRHQGLAGGPGDPCDLRGRDAAGSGGAAVADPVGVGSDDADRRPRAGRQPCRVFQRRPELPADGDLRPHGVLPERPTGPRGLRRDGCRTADTMTLAIEDDVATDLRLLRAYEPAVRYNHGELFFPTNVEGYLRECDLLVGSSERDREVIVPVGELTPERLATATARPGETLYLRLVQRPMAPLELARWRNRPDRQVFHAPGRLARVGLFARLVDAAFSASLLLRGTGAGGPAAAAQVKYARAREDDPRYVYFGRVVRSDGWIVLQYLYFYFMND